MSSKNQTDTAVNGTASTSAPWKRYKRYSDGKKVEARIVYLEYKPPLMEVRESDSEDMCCPACKTMLSRGNGVDFPNCFLPPEVFHERHKPIDSD